MASISKIKDQWRIRYTITLPDGTRRDRSRRKEQKTDAKTLLATANVLEEKTRRLEQTRKDLEHWHREGLLSKHDREDLADFQDGRKTLPQAAEEYLTSLDCCEQEKRERGRRIARVVEILGADRTVESIRHSDGESLKNTLREGWQGRTYKAATVNKHLQDAKRMFTRQLAERVIDYHPFGVLKGVKVPQREKIKQTVLTHEQIKEVIEAAEANDRKDRRKTPHDPPLLDGKLTLFLLMLFGCGLRRKEALAARLENIDWGNRSLKITDTKNGEPRVVGLGEKLFRILEARRYENGYILPRFYPNSVSRAIKRHFRRCGFEMRLHDTRHTYTTRLLDLGVQKHQAMGRTGHKDSRMLDHYSHADFGDVYEDQFPFMSGEEEPDPEPKSEPGEQKNEGRNHLRLVK